MKAIYFEGSICPISIILPLTYLKILSSNHACGFNIPMTHTEWFKYNILSSANTFKKFYRGVDIFIVIIKRECINGSGCVV